MSKKRRRKRKEIAFYVIKINRLLWLWWLLLLWCLLIVLYEIGLKTKETFFFFLCNYLNLYILEDKLAFVSVLIYDGKKRVFLRYEYRYVIVTVFVYCSVRGSNLKETIQIPIGMFYICCHGNYDKLFNF